MSRPAALLVLVLALLPASRAAAANDTLKKAQDAFAYGDYAEASRLTQGLLEGHQLAAEGDLVEANRIAGLSNFYLNRTGVAREAFIRLLTINPDYALDQFLFPPAAVAFFDGVKRDNEGPLDVIRAQRRDQAEKARLQEELNRRALEEQVRRQSEPDRPVLIERVEKRNYALNFFPLGIGEIQEDRPLLAGAFGGAQAAGLITVVVTYVYIASLRNQYGTYSDANYPLAKEAQYIQAVGGAAAGAAWVGAVIDSLTHYEPTVSHIEALPQPRQRSEPGSTPGPSSAPDPATPPPPVSPAPTSMLILPWMTPTSGGIALSLRF